MAGVTPWSSRRITACDDGRSQVIGTRRSSSHGQIAKPAVSATSQNDGAATSAEPNDWSPRWLCTNSIVLTHTSTSATQPQKR
jgi:hypothetical protein